MFNMIDARTSPDQILGLERSALDRWGKGDPGGFLELYAADITYFDPVTVTRIAEACLADDTPDRIIDFQIAEDAACAARQTP